MEKSKLLVIAGVAVILVIGGWILLVNQEQEKQPLLADQPIIEATPTAATASSESNEVKEVQIEAGSFYYKPNEIRVKKGQKVKVVIKSVSLMHNFVIDELKVEMPIVKDGETGTVEFMADRVGEFEYYCSVGQHRQNGQVGKLIVEE